MFSVQTLKVLHQIKSIFINCQRLQSLGKPATDSSDAAANRYPVGQCQHGHEHEWGQVQDDWDQPADEGLGLMSPFLWPPPPKRHWEDSGSFLPSRPVMDQNRFKAYYIKFATKGLDPVWPDLTIFRLFGINYNVFDNFLRVYLEIGKNCYRLW